MQYSININQLAIVNHNNLFGTNLDIIDGVILEYLQKHTTSTFAKRNFKIVDGVIFYLLCYDNIIQQLPLIKIASKDAICRRIDKLLNANVILKHIEKIPNNGTKIYFTTTEIFESFFSYDTTQKSDGDTTQKSDGDTTQKSDELIYDNNINDKSINDKDTASGFSQNDFLENFIKERLSKMSKSAKAGYYAFTVTQLESLAETLGRPLTQMECQERCKMILDKMYPKDGIPDGNENLQPQKPTVKESLTVQKPKKEIEIIKKDDIESFVRTFKASEFEVDGLIQFQSIFSENEIGLITQWILRRKETHKSKVKNTEQAITGVLNDILDIKKEIPLETIFEQRDGCYVHCGASGDASKTHQSIKLEYFTKLIKKPTFNNQYARQKPDYLEVQKRYATTGELQLSTTYRKRRD